ncbi:MAG: S8 family serine peptidase [Balneolales bacterium]
MTFRHLLSVFVLTLVFSPVPFSHAFGQKSTPEYLPGTIIVKLEDREQFFKLQNGIGELRPNDKSSWEKTLTETRADSDPATILAESMQNQSMVEMMPVFRSGASSDISRLKRAGSQPDHLQELAEGFERTYTITYSSGKDPLELALEIARLPGVAYAEPHYVHETTDEFIPNDPRIGNTGHDYFEYQNFFQAWSVSQGSTDVVIAIVDSGVYYDHPDLVNKLWRNPEPGRANDYFPSWEIVNDTIGWNFWESGNVFAGEEPVQNGNPVGNYSTHGTHVAGTAAADTDNEEGISGTGFHAQFMPIKVGGTRQYPRTVAYGMHGILYAAINGADIINCSFGSTSYSEFEQEVMDFATAQGSLIVAAAGNNANNELFYPAAYKNVLAVGSVRQTYNDEISHFSNYGYYVDVFAMGEGLLSTFFDYDENTVSWTPSYARNTGTSMSAPVVSGLAALIKAENPEWSPQRVANQIRVNARSIHTTNTGDIYKNRLGKGLIDAYAAMVNRKPGLQITGVSYETTEGHKINTGESGSVIVNGINYGESSSGVMMELEILQPGISLISNIQNTGYVDTDDSFSVAFEIEISHDFRLDEFPLFHLEKSDAGTDYSDFFMFVYEQLLYEILDVNTILTSISSDGTIGYMDALSSSGGIGFNLEDYGELLFEAGLIITADKQLPGFSNKERVVINQIRDSTHITRHFLPVENFRFMRSGGYSDLDGRAVFVSSEHPVADEVEVEMQTFAFSRQGVDQTFFVKYTITNNSLATLHDMYVGLYNDWDIRGYYNDRTGFIEDDSLIYIFDTSGPPLLTVAHMGEISSALAINNASGMTLRNANSRDDSLRFGVYYSEDFTFYDGFTDKEKYLALTAGTERPTVAGDISLVTATGPFTLRPLASVNVGFIYGWGEDPDDLRSQIAAARNMQLFEVSPPGEYTRYREVADEVSLYQNFPNPFNTSTNLEFHITEPGPVELSIYNVLGQRVATLVNDQVDERAQFVSFDASQLASGVYIAVLRAEGRTETVKMSLVK